MPCLPILVPRTERPAVLHLAQAHLQFRRGALEGQVEQRALVPEVRQARQGAHLGVAQHAIGEGFGDLRQSLEFPRDTHLFARGHAADAAFGVEPLGGVDVAPVLVAMPPVELADGAKELGGAPGDAPPGLDEFLGEFEDWGFGGGLVVHGCLSCVGGGDRKPLGKGLRGAF